MSGRKTILIVDDDPMILNIMALTLRANYDVLLAVDGMEAAYLYQRHPETVAAIVTDLEMPRLSGRRLAEWVHQIRPSLPIIITSGNLHKEEWADMPNLEKIRFLGKPFAPSRLEAELQEALQTARPE
jgi:two-component system, cell cycle sensor histidine kinase and response regulator CckA